MTTEIKALIGIGAVILVVMSGYFIASRKEAPKFYGVACLNAFTYRSGGTPITFDRIPEDQVLVDASGTPRYKNKDSDVVAKLICAQGSLPTDPNAFYDSAVHSPYYDAISAGKINYELVLER